MAVSGIDSRIFRNLFSTEDIRAVFTDEAFAKRMIDVEAALARAQSSAGVIPPEAGQLISEAMQSVRIEYDMCLWWSCIPSLLTDQQL
jgi:3-carboxy-cis,cis-muconate cycloisomerase